MDSLVESVIVLALGVLIASVWAGVLLFYVGEIRADIKQSRLLLQQIAATISERAPEGVVAFGESDFGDDHDSVWFWCPNCMINYPTHESSACPKCENIGHPQVGRD